MSRTTETYARSFTVHFPTQQQTTTTTQTQTPTTLNPKNP